jgi:hypothetical protein
MLHNSDDIMFILSGANVLLNSTCKTYTIRNSSSLYTNYIRPQKDRYAFLELYNTISIFCIKNLCLENWQDTLINTRDLAYD